MLQSKGSALAATLQTLRVDEESLRAELSKKNGGLSFRDTFEAELRRMVRVLEDQQGSLELTAKAEFDRAHTLANQEIRSVHDAYATLHDIQKRPTVQDCIALQDFYTQTRRTFFSLAERASATTTTKGFVTFLQLESLHGLGLQVLSCCPHSLIFGLCH